MDLKTHRNTLGLLRQMTDRRSSTVPRIDTPPQKPAGRIGGPVAQPFPRTSPEAQGMASEQLAAYLEALRDDETLDPHGTLVLRHGAVIAEASFGAYDQGIWHITHSECKSITALAIGMLIDEGRLDLEDKVIRIFADKAAMLTPLTHKSMTVRHLLTMTSGIVFNETGAVTETDWVRCFLESKVLSEPGHKFNYNSMNTYLLSAIVRQVSGQGLMDYLRERLWEPLGIADVFWETCPMGIEKGGWGLYIRPEDMAKVGQLVLQKGRWGDRQLVSGRWIAEATAAQVTTPAHLGGFNYGYQIWVGRERPIFLFNGMFGQNVLGFPDTGVLVVSNAGNSELFQQSSFFRIINGFFPPEACAAAPLPENPAACRRLRALQGNLRQAVRPRPGSWPASLAVGRSLLSLPGLCSALSGRTYAVESPEAAAVGLLPLFTQAIQNNYTQGLRSLGFSMTGEDFCLDVAEADASFQLPIGFAEPKYADLSFHGEPYRVGVTGRFTTNEDDVLVLVLRVSFLEIANARLLKIFFAGDTIITRWSESPGKAFLLNALTMVKSEIKSYPFIAALLSKADNDYVRWKIGSVFEPEITARLVQGQASEAGI